MRSFDYSKERLDKLLDESKNPLAKDIKLSLDTLLNNIKTLNLAMTDKDNIRSLKILNEISIKNSTWTSSTLNKDKISTTPLSFNRIVTSKLDGKTDFEKQIKGYLLALTNIMKGFYEIGLDLSILMDIQSTLMKDTFIANKYRDDDKFLQNTRTSEVSFTPPSYADVPYLMDNLFHAYSLNKYEKDPYYRILRKIMFTSDFVIIHPFGDGNGRMNRLLLNKLFLEDDVRSLLYVSLEGLIFKNLGNYYRSLKIADDNWFDEKDDPSEYILFILNTLNTSYNLLNNYLNSKIWKSKRAIAVLEFINEYEQDDFSINDILNSIHTKVQSTKKEDIEEILLDLEDLNLISKNKNGLYTRFVYNIHKNEDTLKNAFKK